MYYKSIQLMFLKIQIFELMLIIIFKYKSPPRFCSRESFFIISQVEFASEMFYRFKPTMKDVCLYSKLSRAEGGKNSANSEQTVAVFRPNARERRLLGNKVRTPRIQNSDIKRNIGKILCRWNMSNFSLVIPRLVFSS